MSQPVKLSDELVLDARTVGAVARWSIAGQVEFWARLGKSIEPVLRGDRALALQRFAAARPLAESITDVGLRFVNADDLATELELGGYEAADLSSSLRASLPEQGESFVFDTVLSDPVGAKDSELAEAARRGVHVVMIFIRIDSLYTSRQRVAMWVLQGGHDVTDEKLGARFQRTLANLERAITMLPVVIIFDNTDLAPPFQLAAVYQSGERID
jgi:predicted ABC-type ATPase